MLIFIIILIIIYSSLNLIIYLSLRNSFTNECFDPGKKKISIVIAAKNESNNIPNLIASLERLDYPKNQFEIIIADDNSSDDTYEKAEQMISENTNTIIIKVKDKILPGKKGALTAAIENAAYPFILVTDADCSPNRDWLKSYAKKFSEGYDMLFGAAPFFPQNNFTNKIASFENLRSSMLSFTTAKLNFPHSAAARNFGFTKKAFNKINGYNNTTETLSGDDDLLLREALKHKLKIGIVDYKNSFVYSESKIQIGDYIQQRARHTQTSFHYFAAHQIVLGFWHLLNFIFLISIFLSLFNEIFFLLFICKFVIDLLLILLIQKKFNYNFNFIEIIFLQMLYELLLIAIFFYSKFGKVKWK